MIRFINCVRKKEDISHQEFRTYWDDPKFRALIEKLISQVKSKRFEKKLTLQVEMNLRVMEERGSRAPYDGTIEWWWDNAAELSSILENEETKTLFQEMKLFQSEFIDLKRSSAFFTEG
jgi:hypothetical protein